MALSLVPSVLIAIIFSITSILIGSFSLYQLALYLLFGIGAQSVAFCWGRIGILSFGHSLFFGLGAYIAANVMIKFSGHGMLIHGLLLFSGLIPAIFAYLFSFILFSGKYETGPYFTISTLALTLLAYQGSFIFTGFTGGYDGLSGGVELPFWDQYGNLSFLVLTLLCISTYIYVYLRHCPLGIIFKAMSDNENRLQFFGFNTPKLKAFAFSLSAFLTGLAGALFAAHQGIVTPQVLGIIFGTEFVIWCAIGGKNSVVFPVLATVAVGLISAKLRASVNYWELIIAFIFIVIVVIFPDGFSGLIDKIKGMIFSGYMKNNDHFNDNTKKQQLIKIFTKRDPKPISGIVYQDIDVRIGNVQILNKLNLDMSATKLTKGSSSSSPVVCLIGPNGAGKTSAFDVMTGRMTATNGKIIYKNNDLTSLPAFEINRLGIGRKFQIPTIFKSLSIKDNILISIWANRITMCGLLSQAPLNWWPDFIIENRNKFPFLVNMNKKAGDLSQGDKQKLEILMTITAAPEIILMDEPCAGLSMIETDEVTELIKEAAEKYNISFIIVEHDMTLVKRISDKVIVLKNGTKLFEGTYSEVSNSPEVQAVYSGGVK